MRNNTPPSSIQEANVMNSTDALRHPDQMKRPNFALTLGTIMITVAVAAGLTSVAHAGDCPRDKSAESKQRQVHNWSKSSVSLLCQRDAPSEQKESTYQDLISKSLSRNWTMSLTALSVTLWQFLSIGIFSKSIKFEKSDIALFSVCVQSGLLLKREQ